MRRTERRYTYSDYLRWNDGERWELLEGTPRFMSPAPGSLHQIAVKNLGFRIEAYLRNRECTLFLSPFDVRFPPVDASADRISDEEIETIVQPDLLVVCDPAKIDRRGCLGVPDWIIEVLSPSSAAVDMKEKLRIYELHGVREYWILHPGDRTLLVYSIGSDGTYGRPSAWDEEDAVRVGIFPELVIPLEEVFRSPFPGLRD